MKNFVSNTRETERKRRKRALKTEKKQKAIKTERERDK